MRKRKRWVEKSLLLSLFTVLLFIVFPSSVEAHNCGNLRDCYDTLRAAIAATVGLSIFAVIISIGLDFIPVVGNIKGGIEAVTGKDLITGEELEAHERLLGIFGPVGRVAGGAAAMARGIRNVDNLGDAARGTRQADNVSDASRGTRQADNVDDASPGTRHVDEGTVNNGANSAFKADLLKKDLKYTERYGPDARVELPDGRIRYYGEMEAATKPGEMVGRRIVQELNPKTGNVRTWHETLDNSGNIRQVRPQLGPDKTHYRFDENGNYIGKW